MAEPLPPIGESVRYSSGKETVSGFLVRPPVEGQFPGVVLIHDALGLTEETKKQAYRLTRRGYVVLAVDLYRGEAPKTLMDAHILDRGVPEDRVLLDLKSAVDYLAKRKDVKSAALGVVGLGMGGGYALDAALHDARLRAVVDCYGRLITDAKLLEPLKASVFCVFAGKDKGFSLDTFDQFRKAMNKAGKRLKDPRVYSQEPYGFLDPANWPDYGKADAAEVEQAWDLIGDYLDRTLKTEPRP